MEPPQTRAGSIDIVVADSGFSGLGTAIAPPKARWRDNSYGGCACEEAEDFDRRRRMRKVVPAACAIGEPSPGAAG